MCQLLILFLVLWDGAGVIRAEAVREVSEGGNIQVGCPFNIDIGGSRKVFCRKDCNKKENILVETSGNSGRKGRYSIDYKNVGTGSNVIYVNITNVTRSDSGQYECFLDRWGPDGSHKIRIEVISAATVNSTHFLKPTDEPPTSTTTTSDISSTTTELQSPTVSPKTTTQSASTAGGSVLYVGVALAIIVILLSAALVMFCWNKRTNKNKEPSLTTEYTLIPEADRVYEEIQEPNRQNGSGRVDISTVYTSAIFSKPPEDQIYSLASASSNQQQAETHSSELNYSEVDFCKSSDQSVNSAPQRQTEAVLYSAPQVQSEDSDYSTVSLPQQ